MLSLRSSRSFLLAAAVLAVIVTAVPYSRADIVQSTASLPPTTGSYTAGIICVPFGPGVCVVGPSLHGFTGTTSIFDNSGQSIDSSISLTADVYTDVGGKPGTFIAPILLQGPIGILYAGRMSDMDTGTFASSLTELDLTGTFHGLTTHTIEITLGSTTSSGPTTVTSLGSDFVVSSFFDVFAEVSLDGGPFMAGPPRTFTLTPEPGSASLLLLGLMGAAAELRRRARAVLSR